MKKLILFILFFFMVSVGFNALIKSNSPKSFKDPYGSFKLLEKLNDSTEVLILGHSRIKQAIRDTIYPNWVNMAHAGKGLNFVYYQLKYLLNKKLTDPKVVIIAIEYNGLAIVEGQLYNNPRYWKNKFNYLEFGTIKGKPFHYFSLRLKESFFADTYLGRSYIQRQITKSGIARRSRLIQRKVVRTELGLKDLFTLLYDANEDNLRHGFKYLEKIVQLTKEKDLQLIMLKLPVPKSFHEMAITEVEKHDFYQKKVDSVNSSNNHVLLLDYHDIYFDRDDLFKDKHHLNDKGGTMFTKLIKEKFQSNESQLEKQ